MNEKISPLLSKGVQRRFLKGSTVTSRNREKGLLPTLRGHAAVFSTWADIHYFDEQFSPTCFDKTLREASVVALWNHNPDIVLGRRHSPGSSAKDTLRLSIDDIGLFVEIDPPESAIREVEAVSRGDVHQMSIAFEAIREEVEVQEPQKPGEELPRIRRTVTEARLLDVSPVCYPAYSETDIQASVRNCFPSMGESMLGEVQEFLVRESMNSTTPDDLEALLDRFRHSFIGTAPRLKSSHPEPPETTPAADTRHLDACAKAKIWRNRLGSLIND